MKYHNITTVDMKNGDGLRVVLWLSGCNHACPGCQNPVTWDPNDGLEFDLNALNEIHQELQKDYISGITLSGGDPLFPGNRHDVAVLVDNIRSNFPSKSIWIYTGYTWEELMQDEDLSLNIILSNTDVLVDGPFLQDKASVQYPWAGSTNQRVIDVPETLFRGKGEIIIHE